MSDSNKVVTLTKPKADYLRELVDKLYPLNEITISILNRLYHSSPTKYSSYTGNNLEVINTLIKFGFVIEIDHACYSESLLACTKKGRDACELLKICK
jgi:hypothetical protein